MYISKISLQGNVYQLKGIPTEEYQEKISQLEEQVLVNGFVMADAITGDLYAIQIQNGQLVSMLVSELAGE